jgi:thiamine-monophosphate kinase
MVVAGVHFLAEDPPDLVARKALRVNLSDLIAKGARPAIYLLAIALDARSDRAWLQAFAAGLAADQAEYGCVLAGGDTVRTPGPLAISITAIGEAAAGRIPRRSGARPGDAVFVSGAIGDAALGLALLKEEPLPRLAAADRAMLIGAYRLPRPPLALAPLLGRFATAAMDISDGLAGDLGLLCWASNVSAEVEAAAVPLSAAARRAVAAEPALLERSLTGGDDYQVLCTVPAETAPAFEAAAARAGTPVTRIGVIRPGSEGAIFRDAAGRPMRFAQASYTHL